MDSRWNSHSQLANTGEDGTDSSQSRPGSALGGHQQQARNTGSVKQLTSGLLARSKSSAALSSAAAFAAPPTTSRTTAWAKEKIDQHLTASSSSGLKSSIKLDEVRTNQVSETLNTWTARQREPPAAADRCPTPSSCIRQGFAENHSVRRPEMERRPANAWRSRATPEPQLRLVNVSVTGKASTAMTSTEIASSESVLVSKTAVTNMGKEKGIMEGHGGNNLEKTAQDGAGLDRPCQDNRTPSNNTGQEERDLGLPAAAVATAAILAPPTPERNQSFAGGNCKMYKKWCMCSNYKMYCNGKRDSPAKFAIFIPNFHLIKVPIICCQPDKVISISKAVGGTSGGLIEAWIAASASASASLFSASSSYLEIDETFQISHKLWLGLAE
jgi:hypothetical protein